MWGAGRVQGHVDLFDVINALQEKAEGSDCAAELRVLQEARAQEVSRLEEQIQLEAAGLTELTARLNTISAM